MKSATAAARFAEAAAIGAIGRLAAVPSLGTGGGRLPAAATAAAAIGRLGVVVVGTSVAAARARSADPRRVEVAVAVEVPPVDERVAEGEGVLSARVERATQQAIVVVAPRAPCVEAERLWAAQRQAEDRERGHTEQRQPVAPQCPEEGGVVPPPEPPVAPGWRQQVVDVVVIVWARGGRGEAPLQVGLSAHMLVVQGLLERLGCLVQPQRVLLAGHGLEQPGEHRVHGQPRVRRHGRAAAGARRLPVVPRYAVRTARPRLCVAPRGKLPCASGTHSTEAPGRPCQLSRLPLERAHGAVQAERVTAVQGDGPREDLEADGAGEHVLRQRAARRALHSSATKLPPTTKPGHHGTDSHIDR
eukprot:scaffold67158_cov60-Phaeocystis_antarctica.AAC.6